MAVNESGEMYLESIYILTQKSDSVRSIDVGDFMGFSKPSVSRAVGLLKNEGLITTDARGFIRLTDMGLNKAKRIYERHTVLTQLFTALGVNEKTAADDACRVEHCISEETFEAIKERLKKYDLLQ